MFADDLILLMKGSLIEINFQLQKIFKIIKDFGMNPNDDKTKKTLIPKEILYLDIIEDLDHFLWNCSAYENNRKIWISELKKINISNILNNNNISNIIIKKDSNSLLALVEKQEKSNKGNNLPNLNHKLLWLSIISMVEDLHNKGYYHRNICVANIMVEKKENTIKNNNFIYNDNDNDNDNDDDNDNDNDNVNNNFNDQKNSKNKEEEYK
ncbi:hypothetical protein M0812_22818 [Anaeramoeba flamelloides]|uniref:Protein kinase domain-containing protein n=1 Tax=Anaeramoeba flamelloides TaxID=1746091 RepID=A0AAV7YYS8_9EUKA|nr:hypothetical protein M0812_22818 [Anaeramoeba flamelloides]